MTFLQILALLGQSAAAVLALRLYRTYGRHWAWLGIGVVLLVLAALNSDFLVHQRFGPKAAVQNNLFCWSDLLLSCVLLVGLALIDDMFRAHKRTERALTREMRQLSMLVDRRVADLEAEVIERRRAEEALRHDGERFSAIITTQHEIATAELDLDAVMDLIAARTQGLTRASGVIVELVEGDEMVYCAASGSAAPYVGLRSGRAQSLSYECIRTGEILRCNDVERDPRVDLSACRRVGARSLILVPLRTEREVVGVLQILSPEPFAFNAMDVSALQMMAGLIGTAMSHRREFEAKQELLVEAIERADRDPLTGLLNHRAFHNRLHEEADRAQREGRSLALAVIDMDNFKFFNDAYGHAVGDEVLRQVAGALRSSCRSYDILSRFGGDEFAVLMPGASPPEAAELAERLRNCTQGLGFQTGDGEAVIPINLSVGMAVFPDEAPTRLEALELADSRLRRVKYGAGGDREIAENLRVQLSCSTANFSILSALVTAVDNKDRYTRRHSEDVLAYSLQIAKELGLNEKEQQTVSVAALLHDVGKIGIPDSILRKPGTLTEQENRAVQQHPMMGSIIVGAVPGFEETLDAVRHHHERWDGQGYPGGLRREETPLLARIMAVADAYSAMTTDRPYRKGMLPDKALGILQAGAGVQWDPECVAAFLRAHTGSASAVIMERR